MRRAPFLTGFAQGTLTIQTPTSNQQHPSSTAFFLVLVPSRAVELAARRRVAPRTAAQRFPSGCAGHHIRSARFAGGVVAARQPPPVNTDRRPHYRAPPLNSFPLIVRTAHPCGRTVSMTAPSSLV